MKMKDLMEVNQNLRDDLAIARKSNDDADNECLELKEKLAIQALIGAKGDRRAYDKMWRRAQDAEDKLAALIKDPA